MQHRDKQNQTAHRPHLIILIKQLNIFLQFAAWVDAVIFVFSLENESSFNAVYNYYTKMSHFRNSAEIPIILVGTQGIYEIGSVPKAIFN